MHLEVNLKRQHRGFALDVECQVDASTIGLFGPSGAGKTTLLHLLAGLDRPDHGRIVLDGRTLCDTDRQLYVPPHKRRIGLVFQDGRLFPHLTVRGNLRFAQSLVPRRNRRVVFDAVVGVMELEPMLDRWPRVLSGGERQRVAIARTLLSAPQVLLLDEPAAALDANRENQILPFLKRINREFDLPMMLVSHRLSQVRYLTDTMLILNDGRLRAAGQFPAILDDPEVVRLIRGNELLNVLRLRVAEQHPDDGLTTFEFCPSGQEKRATSSIKGPLIRYAQETELTATLRPEDVIITLAPVEHASARNQLSGHVRQLVRKHDRTLCWVDVGVDLLADVTHASASELELHPGKRVWCLFKTHAISYPYEHPNETRKSGSELITREGNDHSETTLAWTRAL